VSVGEDLARAREARGMSVEDVSTATRIRGALIRAIEADDFDACGGAVYARGHLRNIARAVGIDPEPLVAEFDRTHHRDAVPIAAPEQATDHAIAARVDRRGPNWTAAMALALVVICVLAAYGLLNHGGSSPTPAADKPVVTQSATPKPKPVSSPPPSAVAQVPSNVAVAMVRVTGGQTWLQVETLGGKLLFQGLLAQGQSKVFRDARGLRMVIGNAPAVQLVADNRDFGTPRSSGDVAHVTVQPGGAVQFA
jgi:cytoskeletal protein RodZ